MKMSWIKARKCEIMKTVHHEKHTVSSKFVKKMKVVDKVNSRTILKNISNTKQSFR